MHSKKHAALQQATEIRILKKAKKKIQQKEFPVERVHHQLQNLKGT